jgi:hypothetical protein
MRPDADQNAIPDDASTVTITSPPFSAAFDTVFSGGKAQNHGTVGLGVTLSRRFSFDLAYDYSSTNRYFAASAFARF